MRSCDEENDVRPMKAGNRASLKLFFNSYLSVEMTDSIKTYRGLLLYTGG